MTTSMLLSGKAGAAKRAEMLKFANRLYSTAPAATPTNGSNGQARSPDRAVQRELFMDVLSANATKRDAKQYLARFKPPKVAASETKKVSSLQEERNARHQKDQDRLERLGVNLGGLYNPSRAIADTPQFTREDVEVKTAASVRQTIHVALVCLRRPEDLDDATLDGLALTLSQLVKLDMQLVLVLDVGSGHGITDNPLKHRELATRQAERVNRALARHSQAGARLINGALEFVAPDQISVAIPKLLMEPLKRGIVPIIPGFAHTLSGQLAGVSPPSVMSSLTRFLSERPGRSSQGLSEDSGLNPSLDRVIILDSAGGIPSKRRGSAHVFINLEQEAQGIDAELADNLHSVEFGEEDMPNQNIQHQENLRISQECLALLPSASSALIITPQEAASSSQSAEKNDSTIGTGTRRQKNTLIHNLLTNKPLVSSSLPVARIPSSNSNNSSPSTAMPTATLLKRGMPLTIIPSISPQHAHLGWQPPPPGTTSPLNLETDPRVDLARLVHLIEDSFRRKLNVEHYLHRIRNRTAGLIIAGSYEGAAILTWETPAHNPAATPVPYLDKFAVLSSSQGSSGVADIVFQAIVRTCFPQGVCWRSRADNPVNKWYFERSNGTWSLPGGKWTMFWTGEGVVEDERRWGEYVGVCEGVRPSWVEDGKKPD